MSIKVKYKTVKSSLLPAGEERVALCAQSRGSYGFHEMAADISQHTTLTEADAMAAVYAFTAAIREALLRGKWVELEGLGRFYISVGSYGKQREEVAQKGFDPSTMVRYYRLQFRANDKLAKYVSSKSCISFK